MDIETRANRRMGLRRAIGCQLLLLVVLWHFDAASREAAAAWRPVNKISAYVSSVALSKNIVILNHKEQKPFTARVRNDIINFLLVYSADSVSFFSWPICRSGRAEVMSASVDDVIYSVLQIAINSKDHVTASKITTHARTYSRGGPIILETVTEDGVRKIRGRDGWLAVRGVGSEPEAVMDWADIGAELPVLRISGNNSLRNSDDHYGSSDYRINSYEPSGNRFAAGLMFVACGLLFVCSSILVPKAVKRDYDPFYLCLAWFGGFVSLVVPTLWWIWH